MIPNGEVRNLLNQAKTGDIAALGSLMEAYRNYLRTIADQELSGQIRTKLAASDLTQDVFIEALRLFSRFEGSDGDEFRMWLRAILLNKIRDQRVHYETLKRDSSLERSLNHDDDIGKLSDKLPGIEPTPSVDVMRKEEAKILREALTLLPETTRLVITWRSFDGLSFAEIGQRLGRSEDAARMQFVRALERLGEEMQKNVTVRSHE